MYTAIGLKTSDHGNRSSTHKGFLDRMRCHGTQSSLKFNGVRDYCYNDQTLSFNELEAISRISIGCGLHRLTRYGQAVRREY